MIDDPEILSLRERIDAIDQQLLELLAARLEVVHLVGERKKGKGIAVFDPSREEAMLRELHQKAPSSLDEKAVSHIFRAIVSECRRLESEAIDE